MKIKIFGATCLIAHTHSHLAPVNVKRHHTVLSFSPHFCASFLHDFEIDNNMKLIISVWRKVNVDAF